MLGVCCAFGLAHRLPFRRLLLAAYAGSLAWLLSLALVDGVGGITDVLASQPEYLRTARGVTDVPEFLDGYVARIPLDAADHWPTHIAGHPAGMALFFVTLVRIGLGSGLAAGLVVCLFAASIAPAVLLTLRHLGAEDAGRRAAPFLVLTPAAVYLAVSADAVMAAVGAWGVLCLALAATRSLWWGVPAGLLFGALVEMSYGMPLFGLVALAVVVVTRRPVVLPVVAGFALAVVLGFAAAGFAWWEAFPVLRQRYWDGIASDRPGAYWTWANLALLAATTGPIVVASLARMRELAIPVRALVIGALAAVAIADLSQMSRAEVERIWLPFMPWLTLATAALPDRWRRPGLALQVGVALALQHLLHTSW